VRTRPGCEDALLVMAGKRGEGYDQVARAIHRSGLEKAVVELGFVEDEFLAALYATARLTVLPSLNEGFGLPIIEAMAAGCHLVASDTAPVREAMTHGQTATLVDFFDVAGWSRALTDALANPDKYSAIRSAARQHAVMHYDLRSFCLPRMVAFVESFAPRAPLQKDMP
jgi:glycosyltransferase involved in cell wall biosynthesis